MMVLPLMKVAQECFAEGAELDDSENVVFYPNSRLFISRNCNGEKINTTTGKQLITYYVNIWNEEQNF